MIVWLVGGVDPTAGAGLDRDEATLRAIAPDARGVVLVTAQTQQGHGVPATATATDAATLRDRARALPRPDAIKVGLVPASIAEAVADRIGAYDVPRVVDPVLAASDGGTMGARPDALTPVLLAATVITPNRAEAIALAGDCEADVLDALVQRFPHAWVLLKDAPHDEPSLVCDRLAHGDERHVFQRPRIAGPDPRGTGCALATAIAIGLAQGNAVPDAVRDAIAWLDRARTSVVRGPDGRFHLR